MTRFALLLYVLLVQYRIICFAQLANKEVLRYDSLIVALDSNDFSTARRLLLQDSTIIFKRSNGNRGPSILHHNVRTGNIEACEFLLNLGANSNLSFDIDKYILRINK